VDEFRNARRGGGETIFPEVEKEVLRKESTFEGENTVLQKGLSLIIM